MLDQAELALYLLRNSRVNPSLSAWNYLFGNHDFNEVSLEPPGTNVFVHSKPNERASWEYHGKEGYYGGLAKQHYRCITYWMSQSHKIRITDTAALIPHNIPIPTPSIDDHVRDTSRNSLVLSFNNNKPIGPFVKDFGAR